ncbi:MAG: hypothetical protein V4615_02410 [Bacteroidota bacterium]
MLQLDCINHDKSSLAPILDGQIIRASYLLADFVRVSGTTFMGIEAERQFGLAGAQLKKHMILDYAGRVANPKYLEEVKRIYEVLERGRKNVKHETKDMIVTRKKIEKLLDQLFQSSKQELINVFNSCGYSGLMPLVKEEAIFFWGASSENPESDKDGTVSYSEIVSSKWGEDDDELYSFTDPFWEYIHEHNLSLTAFDEADENATAITFPLPDLPVLTSCSAVELKAVKQEVFGDMQPMRQAIEDWSLQLRKENFSANEFAGYASYFTSWVMPYVQTAEERIARCALLMKVNDRLKGTSGTHNYLAICAAKTAWGFMEWSGMVPKQSMHAFEQNMPDGCHGDKAVLLFISRSFNNETQEAEGDKKSLQL